MKQSGKQSGFTLIEVLMSIFILVSSVYVLSDLQIRSMFRVITDREQIERFFLVKKDFFQVLSKVPEKFKRITNKIEDPQVTLVTDVVDLNAKSSLKIFKDKLKILQSEGIWQSGIRKRKVMMIGLIVKSDPEEKKK